MFQYYQEKHFQLQSISQYSHRIDQLEIFLQNVSLSIPNINRKQIFGQVASVMTKSFSTFDLKVVKAWMAFISRMDAANFGVTIIHVFLLQLLIKNQLFKQALKIISTLRLPLSISLGKYRLYLLLSAQVYIEYKNYSEALQSLDIANSIQECHIQPQFLALKLLILTSHIMNRQIQKKDFIRDLDRMKLSCRQQIQIWIQERPQKIVQLEFQIEMFGKICENQQLRQNQLRHLQQKELLELYLKSKQSKLKQLRKYIQKQIYNPVLYRIKCKQINNQPISQFQTIKSINFPTPLFKYDLKNSMMYFQHGKASQQQLNQQIDKICQMNQVIRTRPNIKGQLMEMDRFGRDEMQDERRPVGGMFKRMVGGLFGR